METATNFSVPTMVFGTTFVNGIGLASGMCLLTPLYSLTVVLNRPADAKKLFNL
jgi:hypothetical protein